jgi:hypothetical protein
MTSNDHGSAAAAIQKQVRDYFIKGLSGAVSDSPPTAPGFEFRRGGSRLAIEVPNEFPESDFDLFREGALELRILANNSAVFVIAARFRAVDEATAWRHVVYNWHRDRGALKALPFDARDFTSLPVDGRRLVVHLLRPETHETLAIRRMLMNREFAWSLDRRVAASSQTTLRNDAQRDELLRQAEGMRLIDGDLEVNPTRWPSHDSRLAAIGFAVDEGVEAPAAD